MRCLPPLPWTSSRRWPSMSMRSREWTWAISARLPSRGQGQQVVVDVGLPSIRREGARRRARRLRPHTVRGPVNNRSHYRHRFGRRRPNRRLVDRAVPGEWGAPINYSDADAGALVPAIEGGRRGTRFVDAQCKHGNQVPSPRCPCGIHYSNSIPHIRMFAQLFADAAERHTPHMVCAPRRWALSFGIAAGGVADDNGDPYIGRWKRTRRYYPLGICLPEGDSSLLARVRAHYGVKVVNATSNHALLSIERDVRRRITKRGIPRTGPHTKRGLSD